MLEGKRFLKTVLRYVEDYIEELLYFLAIEKKAEVEVIVEEEKEESLKLRIITMTPDGRKVESADMALKTSLRSFPFIEPIKVEHPPKLIQPIIMFENEIFTEARFPPLTRISCFSQQPIQAFHHRIGRIQPISLPYVSPNFYSWLKYSIKPVRLIEQSHITAFTLKHLLRLIEVPLKIPITSEVKASDKLPILTIERFLVQRPIKATLTEIVETLQSAAQTQQLKGLGLLALLLPEEEEKLRHFIGTSAEYVGEPIIIILPKSKYHLWYLIWITCREVYREVKGVHPEPIVLLERGAEDWLRIHGGISGKVVVLDEEKIGEEEGKKWFRRRLQEAFSQGLGFLILIANDVSRAKESIENLCKPYMARIVDLHVTSELGRVLNRLAKMLSIGFGIPYKEVCRTEGLKAEDRVVTIIEGQPCELPQMDIMVARADRAYRSFLDELLSSNYLAHVRRDVGERESEDHVAMKILAVKDLHERFNVELKDIICTYEVGDEIIADIYVRGKALAIECETMLGTAPAPLLKTFESVRKYIERPLKEPVNEIWIIVRNWPAILHLGDLFWAENVLRKELKRHDKKVKFLIPDIYRKSLVAIDDVIGTIY
ncbi:MAG: hypothetical protein QW782_08745 [Candidatus Bathyarchaeia archaeon]